MKTYTNIYSKVFNVSQFIHQQSEEKKEWMDAIHVTTVHLERSIPVHPVVKFIATQIGLLLHV